MPKLVRADFASFVQEHPEYLLKTEQEVLPFPLSVIALKQNPEWMNALGQWLEGLGLTQLAFLGEGNRSLVLHAGDGEVVRTSIYRGEGSGIDHTLRMGAFMESLHQSAFWRPEWNRHEGLITMPHTALPDDFPFSLPPIRAYRIDDPTLGRLECALYPKLRNEGVTQAHVNSLRRMMNANGWIFGEHELRPDQVALTTSGVPVLVDGAVMRDPLWRQPDPPLPLVDRYSGYSWEPETLAKDYPYLAQGSLITYHDGRENWIHRMAAPETPVAATPNIVVSDVHTADHMLERLAEKMRGFRLPGVDAVSGWLQELALQGQEAIKFPENYSR